MKERQVLKLSVRENFVIFQSYSRRGSRSSQFYMAADALDALETTGTALAMDDPDFAKLRTFRDTDGVKRLCIQFTWLSLSGLDAVHGRRELLEINDARFWTAVDKSRTEEGAWQKLLALPEERRPVIRICSRNHLRQVLKSHTLRKKLGRFLVSNFQWKGAKAIHLADDFLPYSFSFWEERGNGSRGINGAIILHGWEDLRKAHYEIHT